MRRRFTALAAALVLLLAGFGLVKPRPANSEDRTEIALAQTIYALAGREDYDTKLAIGSVVMNRVENPWFSATVAEVLDEQQQFPRGERYDEASLKAARAVLNGKRTLKASALYYQSDDASEPWTLTAVQSCGRYSFYDRDGRI